jgi:CCDC93 protein N-terminal domain
VKVDEDQQQKYEEIVELLLAAGYFRVRIKGMRPFDKVIGGLTWAIMSSNADLDVDIFFEENSNIKQEIKLGDDIVKVLTTPDQMRRTLFISFSLLSSPLLSSPLLSSPLLSSLFTALRRNLTLALLILWSGVCACTPSLSPSLSLSGGVSRSPLVGYSTNAVSVLIGTASDSWSGLRNPAAGGALAGEESHRNS